ncbi:MAG: HEAT repeat protein [Bradymonadia bacterium]|jgi:HEAT repeat protein
MNRITLTGLLAVGCVASGCSTPSQPAKPAAPATTPLQNAKVQLASPDSTARIAGIDWLGRSGAKALDSLNDLVKAAQDPNLPIKLAALNALAQLGKTKVTLQGASQTLTAALRDSSAAVRAAAADAVGWTGDPAAVDALIAQLDDASSDARAAAARALSRIGPVAKRAVGTLAKHVREADTQVSIWSRYALTRLDPEHEDSLKPLMTILGEPLLREAMHAQALEILQGWMHGRETQLAPALIALLKEAAPGSEDELRWLALQISRVAGGDLKQLLPELVRAASDPAHPIRAAAMDALGALGAQAQGAGATVKAALGDADETVRAAAARAYGAVEDGGDAVKTLSLKLLDKSHGVRAAALEGLRSLGDAAKAALPDVQAALKDASQSVRAAAAETLATLSDPERAAALLADLQPLLKDASTTVRAAAARAYGKTASLLGDASEAAKVLAAAVGDDTESVTLAALDGLRSMGAKAKDAWPMVESLLDSGGATLKGLVRKAYDATKDALAD